ncbi:hypothetical protein [Streptomyces sp. NPDC055607]
MLVKVEGTFMGAGLNTRRGQNGQPDQHSIQVDVYQQDSPSMQKSVTVKVAEIDKLDAIRNKYKPGTPISFSATARGYQGNIYLTHESGLI